MAIAFRGHVETLAAFDDNLSLVELRSFACFRAAIHHLTYHKSNHEAHEEADMNDNTEYLIHARALQAGILAAPGVWLPRREILLEWLKAFLARADAPSYKLEETEASDLRALDQFLRRQKVPVAA